MAEAADGKVFTAGRDHSGRPILWLRSKNERTFDNDGWKCGNLINLVYNMERAIHQLPAGGDGKWLLIIDFNGYSMLNAPPMSTSKHTIKILQDHYPERLHCAILVAAPGLFRFAWAALSPFIDKVTKEKVEWCVGAPLVQRELLQRYAPLDQLEVAIGGDKTTVFDPARYLEADPWRGR